jgi:hypothetical protein
MFMFGFGGMGGLGFGSLFVHSSTYPLLDIIFTILIGFAWVLYIWAAVIVLMDIFRRDISGVRKVVWTLVVVIFSWLGVLLYVLLNNQGMTGRRQKEVQTAEAELRDYLKRVAGNGAPATELERAKHLLDTGAIDQAEYQRLKTKVLTS